jgi:hypothetical protein
MKGTISVCNIRYGLLKKADIHLFCGRESSYKPQGSLIFANLGNPHYMSTEKERDAVCKAYEKDLQDSAHPHHKIIKRIAERVAEGKDVVLYCYCKPARCHCDTIKELALNLVSPK